MNKHYQVRFLTAEEARLHKEGQVRVFHSFEMLAGFFLNLTMADREPDLFCTIMAFDAPPNCWCKKEEKGEPDTQPKPV